jgi:hypothetical protein
VCVSSLLDGCQRFVVVRPLEVLHGEAPEVGSIGNIVVANELTNSLQQASVSAGFQHTHLYLSIAVKTVHVRWCHFEFNAKVGSKGVQDISVEMSSKEITMQFVTFPSQPALLNERRAMAGAPRAVGLFSTESTS